MLNSTPFIFLQQLQQLPPPLLLQPQQLPQHVCLLKPIVLKMYQLKFFMDLVKKCNSI